MILPPNKLWLPQTEQVIDRPWFLIDKDTLKEQQRILSSMYFLLRQGDAFGERLKCVKCGNRHDYITLNCVERPFVGLMGGLYAYYRAIGDNALERSLTNERRSRLRGVRKIIRDMPDLSSVHPQLARQITLDTRANDLQMGAVALGMLEGIPPTLAHKLEERINARGIRPKFVLEAPNIFERQRVQRWSNGTPIHR